MELICRIWRALLRRRVPDSRSRQTEDMRRQDQRVKEILSFLHTHFQEPLRIHDIARAAAVSRTECFRCFQTVLGKSPGEYLTEYRLSAAASLMIRSEKPLAEIAHLCGFRSPSYFGKVFREKCGIPPGKFREQFRGLPEKD